MSDDDDRYHVVSRPYARKYHRLVSDHVFDKLRSLDMTLGEFVAMLNDTSAPPEVIAEAQVGQSEMKELVLLFEWKRPLHAVIVVNEARAQERIATVYEPFPTEWTVDFRRRRH